MGMRLEQLGRSRPRTFRASIGKGDIVGLESKEHTELIELVRAWDQSMVANDTQAIGSFMTDDWIIVGPDGSIDDREPSLELIASGELTHHTMTSEDVVIRVLGDSAFVVARGVSAGAYRGRPRREQERSSHRFVRRDAMDVRPDSPVEHPAEAPEGDAR